jgi:AcrR family transcriptional regulator
MRDEPITVGIAIVAWMPPVTTPGPRQRNRAARRERILQAATELFRERGFADVGVAELGVRAGLNGPAIYRYFSSKEEILATICDRAMDSLLLELRPEPEDPQQAIEELVAAYIRFALGNRAQLAVYNRDDRLLAEADRRRAIQRQIEHVDRWISVLRRCHPDADERMLRTATQATLGLLRSVAQWPKDALADRQLAEHLQALAMATLSALG